MRYKFHPEIAISDAWEVEDSKIDGFLMTVWHPTIQARKFAIYKGINLTKQVKDDCYNK